MAKEVVLRTGIRRSFRNDRRTISIEGGGTSVHLAHLTVTRTYRAFVPSRLSLSLSPSVPPLSTTLPDLRNVRFLMIVIEIYCLLIRN